MGIVTNKRGGVLLVLLLLALAPASHASATASDTDGDGLTNAFEQAYDLNPDLADSDGDGLLDPGEDADRDGLSNMGEQRFGTNPLVSDSDSDGIGDAIEDANDDGVPNWKQQDHRAVPDPTTPPLGNPNDDTTCYWPGHGVTGNCTGDANGTRSIAIYGDSHSGQWIAALQVAAIRRHWKLAGYANSGC